jgi:hypothetical protein
MNLSRPLTAFFLLLLVPSSALTATINAASCSASDVQAAINAASDGDTVQIPVGACTWSSPVSTSNKRLVLAGSGSKDTVITASNTNRLNVPNNQGQTVTIKDFKLRGVAGVSGLVRITGTVKDFRITGMQFEWTSDGSSPAGMLKVVGTASGLIDQNTFAPTSTQSFRSAIQIEGDSTANAFTRPSILGTANTVVVEDNLFTQPAPVGSTHAIWGQTGATWVFRHNTVINWDVDQHGPCSWHGSREFEIYDNAWSATANMTGPWIVIRGGTGVVYNNRFTSNGFNTSGIRLRMQEVDAGSQCNTAVGGQCYICRAPYAGTYPWNYQLGRGTNNVLDPIYLWGNRVDGVIIAPHFFPNDGDPICEGPSFCNRQLFSSDFAQPNRDYSTSDAAAKPGYTPLAYPHPLRATDLPPAPPSGLRISGP